MSLLDRPIRKNRGTMPQRFRDLEVSIEDPKSGAEYFQVARAAGEFEDTQVQPLTAPAPVERTKARTRGHTEHPGYKPPGSKSGRKKKAQRQQRARLDSGDTPPVVVNLDIDMESDQDNTLPVIEIEPEEMATEDLFPSYSDVWTRTKRTYRRAMPEDGSDPAPLTKEEIEEIEQLEDDLEQVILKREQWRIQMTDLDKRIQEGINRLRMMTYQTTDQNPNARRKSTRANAATDYLIGDMNANIAMGLVKAVSDREKELEEESDLDN